MDYGKKSNYDFFKFNICEHNLAEKYDGNYIVGIRNGFDLEKSSVNNPEFIPSVLHNDGNDFLNPLFTYDRNSVKIGRDALLDYVNARGLELLYDIRFGYDGSSFEIVYHNPRELQLFVNEGDGWKKVFDRYQVGNNEDKIVSLKICFGDDCDSDSKSYKMRKFILRTTGWFGGIIREKNCSIVKTITSNQPLAVFEGSSITESCNDACNFNAYSYARILSDIFGFEYLCLAQGGTGMARPFAERPCLYDRIDKVLEAKPDILFLEVGVNDKACDLLKSNTENYLKTIREKLPNTFVVMIGTYSPKNIPEITPVRKDVDIITSEKCKKYGIPFIEISTGYIYGFDGEVIADMGVPLITGTGRVFEPNGTGTADRYVGKHNVNDSCHCNAIAYRMFAEYIRSAFNSILNNMK